MPSDWAVACLAVDLPPLVVLRSDCLGAELALWRSATGRVSAWRDRCQHRGMRLSHGFVRGETLACIYHGWVYGTDGGCHRIPAHPALVPPAAIRADAFRCVEASGAIWVAAADTAGGPPDLGEVEGVRSMAFDHWDRPPGFDGANGLLRGTLAGHGVVLAVQPAPTGVMIHALCAAGLGAADKIALSRALEALRWQTEAAA